MTQSFSIVIPTFNRKHLLAEALESVRAQNWTEIEIIVVDGGSTDGTIEEIERDKSLQLLMGPDRGVYDALNKGIAAASGEIVGLLNSDDLYELNAFAAVADAFSDSAAQSVCGGACLMEDGRTLAVFDNQNDKQIATPRTVFIGSCIPNARFFRRAALQQVGPFSLDYRYIADRDWLARWYEAGLESIGISRQVYKYRQHPGSLTFDADRMREAEIRKELLKLARFWRNALKAKPETRNYAALLEGRCIGWLAFAALKSGHIAEAIEFATSDGGRLSSRPMVTVLHSVKDWIAS